MNYKYILALNMLSSALMLKLGIIKRKQNWNRLNDFEKNLCEVAYTKHGELIESLFNPKDYKDYNLGIKCLEARVSFINHIYKKYDIKRL